MPAVVVGRGKVALGAVGSAQPAALGEAVRIADYRQRSAWNGKSESSGRMEDLEGTYVGKNLR